jgi:hypothetical protein
MNKDIFENLSIDLKGDYVFQKGSFVGGREYGFVKMALYKTKDFFIEVHIAKESLKIINVVLISESDVKRFYKGLRL